MNPFSDLMKDEIFIVDTEGNKSGPFKTVFSPNKVIIDDENLNVAEGDKLLRTLPNGKEDTYTIVETSFQSGLHSIPSHYVLSLNKDSAMKASTYGSKNTTINISESQGIQIGDHNIQNISESLTLLIAEIEKSDITQEEKIIAKSKIRELLDNPTVAAILGAAAGGLLALL